MRRHQTQPVQGRKPPFYGDLDLPESWPLCLDAFAQAVADILHCRLLDHRGTPPSPQPMRRAPMRRVCWPPYCPALNPIARMWRDLKNDRARPPCADLQTPQADVWTWWQADEAATSRFLLGEEHLMEGNPAPRSAQGHLTPPWPSFCRKQMLLGEKSQQTPA
jgi:hypothetical protein